MNNEPTVTLIKAKTTPLNRNAKEVIKLRVAAYARVSTDSEDQLNSYNSQVRYYNDLINSKNEWTLVKVYADPGITGTQTINRVEFLQMIEDAYKGRIDMIVTKSISRFARNTVDTLNYVRKLKEKGVAVLFEEENINTLTMDGELLLTILSSVAQQEVQNISANVKKGLKMKMERGEMVGFNGCFGYDYIPGSKKLVINEREAEIVRIIFKLYLEGYGGKRIANYLTEHGYKNKNGEVKWVDTTIASFIRNEKYIGDVRLGKTFTVDPISKKRLDNKGESDQYYIQNHHEPIISREDFQIANEIMDKKGSPRKPKSGHAPSPFIFSGVAKCGYCGSNYTRRTQIKCESYIKKIWHCVKSVKDGKRNCPHSLAVPEELLEQVFIQSFNILQRNEGYILDDFMNIIKDVISSNPFIEEQDRLNSELNKIKSRKDALLDLFTQGSIDKDRYESSYNELTEKIKKIEEQLRVLENKTQDTLDINQRFNKLKDFIFKHRILDKFDKELFNKCIDTIYIGGYDKEGNNCPHQIEIVYKLSVNNDSKNKDRIKVGEFETRFDFYYFPVDEDGFRSKILKHSVPTIISFKVS